MYTTRSKQTIGTDSELGKGGEGVVYSLQRNMIQVAKIYHDSHRTAEKEQKLQAMIANPPSDDTRQFNPPHISIAWPEELIYENRKFAGYLMPKIMTSPEIFEVFSPVTRKKKYPNFDWRYAHRAAQNLAIALNALHVRNYIMGDVNQKNILVTDQAMITLVDTDSFQVTDTSGRVYRCPVGVPEYTPPELQGVSLGTVNRFEYHDNFGLAVLIFQLLMDGNHPFMGVPQNLQQSFGKVDQHCIKQGIFPYQTNRDFLPPPHAPRFESLHPDLQRLFLQTFVNGHKTPAARTDAHDWAMALKTAENALVQCQKNPAHWYSNHSPKCHWCEREKRGSVVLMQQPLTPSTPVQQLPAPVKKTPVRKATVNTPPAKSSSSFSWKTIAWVVFALFIFWLGARALSASMPAATQAPPQMPAATEPFATQAPATSAQPTIQPEIKTPTLQIASPIPEFVSPTPAWSGILVARKPNLNEIRAEVPVSIWDENLLVVKDLLAPGTANYSGDAQMGKEYLFPVFWCALTSDLLVQNMDAMETKLFVNGEVIPDKFIFVFDFDTKNGWSCRYHSVILSGWVGNGKYTLQATRTLFTELSDGQNSFPAGSYVYKLSVIVR